MKLHLHDRRALALKRCPFARMELCERAQAPSAQAASHCASGASCKSASGALCVGTSTLFAGEAPLPLTHPSSTPGWATKLEKLDTTVLVDAFFKKSRNCSDICVSFANTASVFENFSFEHIRVSFLNVCSISQNDKKNHIEITIKKPMKQ